MIGVLLLHDDKCETPDVPHEIPIDNVEALVDGDEIAFNGNVYKLTRRAPRLNKTGPAGNLHGKFFVQSVFEAEFVRPIDQAPSVPNA